MERQESPTSSTPANFKAFVVKKGEKMVVISSPPALMDSELTACSQSMIVDEPGDTTTNVSMETNANSKSIFKNPEEDLDPNTPYKRKLRSSPEWEEFEMVEKN